MKYGEMKKVSGLVWSLICLTCVLASLPLLSASAVNGEGGVCGDVMPIPIADDNYFNMRSGIAAALTNYKNYSCQNGSAYCLCFEFQNFSESWDMSRLPPLSLDSTGGGKPVIISGLQLIGTSNPLTLSGTQPITLINSSFSNCVNCLSINGDSFRIENVSIECAGKERGGVGIKIFGDRHRVSTTEISHCAVGLQIGDETHVGNNIHVGPDVVAHGNGIAFHIVHGFRNFFRKNYVFSNDNDENGIFSNLEGILGGLPAPIILNKEEKSLASEVGNVLFYSEKFECPLLDSWNGEAKINFKMPFSHGNAEISFNDEAQYDSAEDIIDHHQQQGKIFFTEPDCSFKKIAGGSIANCSFHIDQTQVNRKAVLIYHSSRGTSTYSLPFLVNDPCRYGVFSGVEMEPGAGAAPEVKVAAPGGVSEVDTGTQVASGGGGQTSMPEAPIAGPSNPAPRPEEKKKEDGQGAGVSNPAGDAPASVIPTGVAATGAPGGVGVKAGGCGGSINPNEPNSSADFLVILFLVLNILVGIRGRVKN